MLAGLLYQQRAVRIFVQPGGVLYYFLLVLKSRDMSKNQSIPFKILDVFSGDWRLPIKNEGNSCLAMREKLSSRGK